MLSESIRTLIADEQRRQRGRFLDGVDVSTYLAKLEARGEILSDSTQDHCRGFVAFYCNDETTRQAYITLVLIDPRDRGRGLGRALVGAVLDIARRRGYRTCRLEVAKQNDSARALYMSMGFQMVEARALNDLLEVAL
jgi:ribosomal protein S18 acetylase RimI-like enzyme